jgi:hypothetical protein
MKEWRRRVSVTKEVAEPIKSVTSNVVPFNEVDQLLPL